jgi:hypothetical protein
MPELLFQVSFYEDDFDLAEVRTRYQPQEGDVNATQFLYHAVRRSDGARLPEGNVLKVLDALRKPIKKGVAGLEPLLGTDGQLYFNKAHLDYLRDEFGLVSSFRKRELQSEGRGQCAFEGDYKLNV